MIGAAGSRDRAYSICAGIAPTGTVSVRVFFHRSHITQRHGHSRLVRNSVFTATILPSLECSSSAKNCQGRVGSRSGVRIIMSKAKETVCGTQIREKVIGGAKQLPAARRAESAVSERPACSGL